MNKWSNFDSTHPTHPIRIWDGLSVIDSDQWQKIRKERLRWAAINQRYHLTQDEWQALFNKQHGRCPICGADQDELNHPLEIDQDLATGKIRGLLCRKCNSGIALLGEDVGRLKSAIRYLERD